MPHYETDDYVQEHWKDGDINVNYPASWRVRLDDEGRVESLFVDLHNS